MIVYSERKPTPTTDFFDKALDLFVESVKLCTKIFDLNTIPVERHWHADDMRNRIMDCMNSMISNLTHADKIYIRTEFDYNMRRSYMNKAIGDVETAIKLCELSKRTLDIKVSRFTVFHGLAVNVINLIKDWRKSDNKIMNRIKENS